MNLFTKQKQTQRHGKQTYGYPKQEKGWKRDKLGVWDQQIHTAVYKTDKQQSPTYNSWNYIQYPVIDHNGKEYEK